MRVSKLANCFWSAAKRGPLGRDVKRTSSGCQTVSRRSSLKRLDLTWFEIQTIEPAKSNFTRFSFIKSVWLERVPKADSLRKLIHKKRSRPKSKRFNSVESAKMLISSQINIAFTVTVTVSQRPSSTTTNKNLPSVMWSVVCFLNRI